MSEHPELNVKSAHPIGLFRFGNAVELVAFWMPTEKGRADFEAAMETNRSRLAITLMMRFLQEGIGVSMGPNELTDEDLIITRFDFTNLPYDLPKLAVIAIGEEYAEADTPRYEPENMPDKVHVMADEEEEHPLPTVIETTTAVYVDTAKALISSIIPMHDYFVTFGQQYRKGQTDHPVLGEGDWADGWMLVRAANMEHARELVVQRIGMNWSSIYAEDEFAPKLYPLGELCRIEM